MTRVVHALIVAILMLSASGVSASVIGEPCTGVEEAAEDDGACPPTCVTCGCCAQAVEPATVQAALASAHPVADIRVTSPGLSTPPARGIFHVPKAVAL